MNLEIHIYQLWVCRAQRRKCPRGMNDTIASEGSSHVSDSEVESTFLS
jgi:hypothetical protein